MQITNKRYLFCSLVALVAMQAMLLANEGKMGGLEVNQMGKSISGLVMEFAFSISWGKVSQYLVDFRPSQANFLVGAGTLIGALYFSGQAAFDSLSHSSRFPQLLKSILALPVFAYSACVFYQFVKENTAEK